MRSPGIRACTLPESFRVAEKQKSFELNYATLTCDIPDAYQLGSGDVLRVEIADLEPVLRFPNQANRVPSPFSYVNETRVDDQGKIMLPMIGSVEVEGMSVEEARQQIMAEFANGYLDNPKLSLSVVQRRTVRVMVLGNVAQPAVYELPKYENDVAHAITMAGGLVKDQAREIQVHRRTKMKLPSLESNPLALEAESKIDQEEELFVFRIPLRVPSPISISPEQVELNHGDVVVVRGHPDEVFFVVGKLSQNNLVRFSLARDNRDLGNGFVLPKDRDIDVVTAVAMAGYIDPIDSPTTVTVHRTLPDGEPMLIHVDLIAARSDRKETVMIHPGDIIYLNPDIPWWFRRTFDRVIPSLITAPYAATMKKWINPRGLD
ncbi:MAG: polysaccharide biosynthesis/export family protein [Pirellulaceae bacterium]|nr:polysaccharide biosynthesis/export family protein [Pirellulaceae bacterium]